MVDILDRSARYLDENLYEGAGLVNRPTTELSEIADGVALIEAFSHVISFRTQQGLVLFDTSLEAFAGGVLKSMRRWSPDPVSRIVYTHGHVDHVGGAGTFIDETLAQGAARPNVVGHENVAPRFDRYELTNGYNWLINARQFAPAEELRMGGDAAASKKRFGPEPFIYPDLKVDHHHVMAVGELTFDLRHGIGETDDHLWAYIPEHRAICCGDFVTWVFPNAGNPQKVQRYPLEWARALREMAALKPELLLPAHGLPVAGQARIEKMLLTIAEALEYLVRETLQAMNAGASLDDILHQVKLPPGYLDKPYLRPVYDEPEFILHNIWRLYGGWYDGNPARLKPAKDSALANEIAQIAGGADVLAKRALQLVAQGDLRLACHLAEFAVQAAPDQASIHQVRAQVYQARRKAESSLMAKGIFGAAERDSAKKAQD
jgi:alkyl sulfatase BDS1-like metallo-beta-lactamase superfamily hydrolase